MYLGLHTVARRPSATPVASHSRATPGEPHLLPQQQGMFVRTCDIEKGRVWCDDDKLDRNVTVVILVCCDDSRDWGEPGVSGCRDSVLLVLSAWPYISNSVIQFTVLRQLQPQLTAVCSGRKPEYALVN